MIIALARQRIALTGAVDPVIEAMVNLMPDYSAGRRLHALYVNKVQSALPGNYSQLFGSGPSFRSVFFRDWRSDPLLATTDETGLNQSCPTRSTAMSRRTTAPCGSGPPVRTHGCSPRRTTRWSPSCDR
jgi:hypothetical protein